MYYYVLQMLFSVRATFAADPKPAPSIAPPPVITLPLLSFPANVSPFNCVTPTTRSLESTNAGQPRPRE